MNILGGGVIMLFASGGMLRSGDTSVGIIALTGAGVMIILGVVNAVRVIRARKAKQRERVQLGAAPPTGLR